MVGLQESINLVKERLRADSIPTTTNSPPPPSSVVDHDAILRDYDKVMRDHERRMNGHRRHIKRHREERSQSASRSPRASSKRFRFKKGNKPIDGDENHTKHRRRSRDYDHHRHEKVRIGMRPCSSASEVDRDADVAAYAAHPLPRPRESDYLDPAEADSVSPQPAAFLEPRTESVFEGPDDAFRASLFDAIADDEGAAYWEGVYGEPIHIYSRPTVKTDSGGLEEMNDDQYAEYVKRKMWEKKNPELVKEREDRARREMEEDQRRQRRKKGRRDDDENDSDYEWVGNEEKGYERRRVRGQRRHPREIPTERNRGFMSDVDEALARGAKRKEEKKWRQAWSIYRAKWEQLKESKDLLQDAALARAIPWPVLSGNMQDANQECIAQFFRNYPLEEDESRMALLKAERVRWHPDKIQHRFGGDNVDAETLAMVTGVFQAIDNMMAEERKRAGE